MAKRNPQFVTGPIAFKPEALRKFFDLVWDQAQKAVPAASDDDLAKLADVFFNGRKA